MRHPAPVDRILPSNSFRLRDLRLALWGERGKTRVVGDRSRVRSTKRKGSRCQHHIGPVVVEREERGHTGRCLECGTLGPTCETVEEAYRELRCPRLRYPGRNTKVPRQFRR
jgi:hypothetical protein